jgi:DNA-binding Lrp family transcriptional regulator
MEDQGQTTEGRRTEWEELRVAGSDIVERVRELIRQGNIRRIVIRQDGKTVMELSLTWAAIGTLLAPMLAAVGAFAALASDCTIVVERLVEEEGDEGTPDA